MNVLHNLQATIWLAAIGFSLLFGTMLAKTWRVYYIFRSVKLKKKVTCLLLTERDSPDDLYLFTIWE